MKKQTKALSAFTDAFEAELTYNNIVRTMWAAMSWRTVAVVAFYLANACMGG